jgi:hypothetical protein
MCVVAGQDQTSGRYTDISMWLSKVENDKELGCMGNAKSPPKCVVLKWNDRVLK